MPAPKKEVEAAPAADEQVSPAARVEEPPPPVAKKDQEKFDALVKEKRAAGLPREDAELVARRQIAEDSIRK